MNRRSFLSWVSLGWLASFLPVAIAACSPNSTETSLPETSATDSTPPRADGFQEVGTVEQLDRTGKIMNKKFAAGPMLIIRNPDAVDEILAVNPMCTHQGCTVEWEVDKQRFYCPCHSSEFAPNGTAIKAPAREPLKTYEAKIEGNKVIVKAN